MSLEGLIKKDLIEKGVVVHFTSDKDSLVDRICNYNGRFGMFKFLTHDNFITDGMTKMKKKFHRWYHIVRVPNDCLVILSGKEIEKPVKEQSIVGEQKSRKKYKEYEMDDFQKFLLGQAKWRKK